MSTFDDYLATFEVEPGYLNWAAFGPLSPSVRAEVFADADLLSSGRPSSLALITERIEQARTIAAELLGLDMADVTVQPSSTHGLMHAMYGLTGEVIAARTEFPSVSMTLERAAQFSRGALTPRWIEPHGTMVTPDAVAESLDDSVTALAVSHVDFRTGYRTDLAALRDVLGPDRLLIVDAVQSFGVVEDDYAAADVIVGHGYKWLRAGRGTGFAAFSALARERIEPVLSNFLATDLEGIAVDELPPPSVTAQAFTVNVPDQLAVARLAQGLLDVQTAGVAAIQAAVEANVDALLEVADRHSIPVITPRAHADRAGILALAPEAPAPVSAALANVGVVATTRGASIRLAPHAGTTGETIALVDEALRVAASESFTIS